MPGDFLDTNVILYLLDKGKKADRTEKLLTRGAIISVQVLNETLVNCIRKAGMSWREAGMFLHAPSRCLTSTLLFGRRRRLSFRRAADRSGATVTRIGPPAHRNAIRRDENRGGAVPHRRTGPTRATPAYRAAGRFRPFAY